MDKDTKFELLKILAMVVVLVLLIAGIVWINRDDIPEDNNTETIETQNTEDLDLPDENETESETESESENETEPEVESEPETEPNTEEENTENNVAENQTDEIVE